MKIFKYIVAFIFVFMIFSWMQPIAYAANNASVLETIGHEDTDTVTLNDTTRTVTLTVPYAYAGTTVDLSNGLDITYDEDLYKYVVAQPYSVATVGGVAVSLTVSYNGINDQDGTAKNETVYSVSVVRATAKNPEFSGAIKMTATVGDTITFSAADFAEIYEANDGADLGFVVITGSNTSKGTLQYAGIDYDFNHYTWISIGQINSGYLTFDAAASGTVSFNVDAYSTADIDNPVGSAVLTITINPVTKPTIEDTITGEIYSGSYASFSQYVFTSSCDLNGGQISTVEITPTNTGYGTWYLDRTTFTTAKEIVAADIENLYFAASAIGTATFKWRVANEAGYSDYGTGSITVSSIDLELTSFTASTEILKGKTYAIEYDDFACTPTYSMGYADSEYTPILSYLRYIKLSTIPDSADGYLCLTTNLAKSDTYGYPAIVAGKSLGTGAIIPASYIQYLTLVTKSTSPSSSISFTWTATADSVASKAIWATDAASYTVDFVSAGSISYETDLNLPVTFDVNDFSSEFEDMTGYTLSYVTFTLPDKAVGVLYHNYSSLTGKGTAVAAGTKYYKGMSPEISKITFVPVTGYTGTIETTYNAYSSDGTHATGDLEIVVSDKPGGTLSYTTDKNSSIYLDAQDFKEAFASASGATLSYVKFSLPSSSYGKLYFNDDYSEEDRDAVSSSTKYYVSDSPYLSYISFVPHDDYTGDVEISYTGYDDDDNSYKGKLKITVEDSPAGIVYYTTNVNSPLSLNGDDFADEFITVTGSVLSYVNFTVSKTGGVLYYDYSSATEKGMAVASGSKYYYDSDPDLDDLTFLPATGYTGLVTIPYIGYTETGIAYAGKLKITMEEDSTGSIEYTTSKNETLNFDVESFSSDFYDHSGESLSYIKFTLPSASYGKLYYNETADSEVAVSATTKYYRTSAPYISKLSFLPYTNYVGDVNIPYTGYTSSGIAYTGKVIITIDDSQSFSDIGEGYSWANEAIEYLYRENIINGTGNDCFSPQNKVLRGDFMLMLGRAFEFSSSDTSNFSDVEVGSYYYNAIAAAKALGVVTGSYNKFFPDAAISRQDAMVILVRALSLTDDLPEGNIVNLYAFSDRKEVADYAVEAMGTLVKAGLIKGNNGLLNPRGNITRAEMAVIIYRALNM